MRQDGVSINRQADSEKRDAFEASSFNLVIYQFGAIRTRKALLVHDCVCALVFAYFSLNIIIQCTPMPLIGPTSFVVCFCEGLAIVTLYLIKLSTQEYSQIN